MHVVSWFMHSVCGQFVRVCVYGGCHTIDVGQNLHGGTTMPVHNCYFNRQGAGVHFRRGGRGFHIFDSGSPPGLKRTRSPLEPQVLPDGSQMLPDVTQMILDVSQMLPDAFQMLPKCFQMLPRCLPDGPRCPQMPSDAPRCFPDSPSDLNK